MKLLAQNHTLDTPVMGTLIQVTSLQDMLPTTFDLGLAQDTALLTQVLALTLPLLTMEEKVRTSSSRMAVPTADLAAPGPHASLWAPITT